MEAIHEEVYKGLKIEIIADDNAESPREWDNLGTMVCWHSRYTLGDEHSFSEPNNFRFSLLEEILGDTDKAESFVNDHSEDEVKALIAQHYFIKPLFLYDHSGISISTGSFVGRAQHAQWDSGQVGYIYVSREAVRKEWKVSRISKKLADTIEKNLDSEVNTYDDYLRGNVYGFKVLQGEEELDSCWGFIGDYDSKGGCLDSAKESADYEAGDQPSFPIADISIEEWVLADYRLELAQKERGF
jgi:hypothetical protein